MKPIIERIYMVLRSVRIIFDKDKFFKMVKDGGYSFIVLISHEKLDIPPSVAVKSKKTIVVPLRGDIEDVLAKFNDTSRNEIRRTFKSEELSFSKGVEDFERVYEMYKEFRKSKNMPVHSKSFLKSAMIYKAYLKEELISVVTCYDVYPHLRIQNIFSISSDGDRDLRRVTGYATRRLVYEICEYGTRGRYKLLDLAGINITNPSKRGITQFKKSFGGDITEEYTYTYKSPILRMLKFWK